MTKIKYHETYTYVEMEEVKLSAGGRIVISFHWMEGG